MYKSIGIIVLVLTLGLVVSATRAAGSSGGGSCAVTSAKASDSDTPVNTICPVMGGAIPSNTPYRVTYNGKTIGFCCAQCVKEFKAHPEKYASKLPTP